MIEQSALLSVSAINGGKLQPLDLLQPLAGRMEMLASSVLLLEGMNVKLMDEVSALSYIRDTVEAGRDVLLGEREQLVGQLKQANIAAAVSAILTMIYVCKHLFFSLLQTRGVKNKSFVQHALPGYETDASILTKPNSAHTQMWGLFGQRAVSQTT